VQKMVPKDLAEEQKQRRVTIYQDLLERQDDSQVMKHGFTNTTLKRSGEVHNGRLPIPYDHKCSASPNQE